MNSLVLHSLQTNFSLKSTYQLLFAVYFAAIVVLLRQTVMPPVVALELKIWILTAGLSLMLTLLAFFLKRLLDSFEKKTEKIMEKQDEHNDHIVSILQQIGFHREKLDWLERKIERRSASHIED